MNAWMGRRFVERGLSWLLPLIYRIRLTGWWVLRPLTMGARMIVVDDGQVLLVRGHGSSWWGLPGGAVKRNEPLAEAARREVREETGCIAEVEDLLGMYFNGSEYKSDHVAIFTGRLAVPGKPSTHVNFEISEARFFPLAQLPEQVDRSTRARLAEYASGRRGNYGLWSAENTKTS